MNGFQFRLERVLHWRGLELASEETRLKRLIEEEAQIESAIVDIRRTIQELPAALVAADAIYGSDLTSLAGYRARLTAQHDRLLGQRQEKKHAVAEQVQVHRKAKQRHQLLLELRSRRRDEWNLQMARQLDELAHESYLARWTSA